MAAKRALPAKETAAFKNLLHLYETRSYKQAIKVADQILKKVPDHGETTSMKGLVLTNLQKKEEGIQLVKKGVLLDVTSHICWHVYGIVHKADHNYEEALKCYLRALKFDKDNVNILRDTAQLQLQLRQYDALLETRQALLRLRPNARAGWVGLAVAYRLNGRPHEARKVLEQYLTILKGVPDYDVEFSELMVYYVTLIEESGDLQEALQVLDANAKSRTIVDKTSISLIRARLLQKMGHLEQSAEVWRGLLDQNPESHEYYKEYILTQGVDLGVDNVDEQRDKALDILAKLGSEMPKSNAPKRLALSLASGDRFTQLAQAYLTDGLTRGIPSLFADLKSLYGDQEKVSAIFQIVTTFSEQYSAQSNPDDPTPYVWATYFLAQHQSQVTPEEPEAALSFIDAAISHTPTLPELYMLKARIQKRAGDSLRASYTMDEARKLDLQDRFLNTKSAKYYLRDGQTDTASTLLGLFTKKDAITPGADLEEMQSLLYLLEEGESYRRQGKLSMALKRYHGLEKTFVDFEDDQFDFHSYCVRRHTLIAYHGLLQFEDTLRSHPAYVKAALAAAEIYIRLYDDRPRTVSLATACLGDSVKKPKKKAKKGDKKPAANGAAADDKDPPPPPPKDEDPDGMKLLQANDPLERAHRFVKPLEALCPDRIGVWLALYDINVRRGKHLQAAKALRTAHELDKDDPELHHRLVHFKVKGGGDEKARSVAGKALADALVEDVSAEVLNTTFLQRQPASPPTILSSARGILNGRGADGLPDAEDLLFQITRPETQSSLQAATEALNLLRQVGSSRSEELRAALSSRYPHATVFKSESEKSALRSEQSKPPDADEPVGPI